MQTWMWRNSCEGQGQARPLWVMSRPSRSLIDVSWALTSSRYSSPGQVVQLFQRGSDYVLIAGGLR